MKRTYYIMIGGDHIATIFSHARFGMVIVFETKTIDITGSLEIYNADTEIIHDEEIAELVLDAMPYRYYDLVKA